MRTDETGAVVISDDSILPLPTGASTEASLSALAADFSGYRAEFQEVRTEEGEIASPHLLAISGKTNDGSPTRRPIPLGPSGRSVIIEGHASGVPVNTKSIAATATTSQVADSASNVTLLSLNANRLGATIANDSSAALYVKLGTTASTTDYTVRLTQYAYYEVPFGYTGRIDGIWASDPADGAARITELT